LTLDGDQLIILFVGGTKKRQQSDIRQASELLREAAIGHEVDPTTPAAEARRERVLAKMLILLSLLRLGRFGRQRRALQRALGVSDEVLAEVQAGMAEQLAWGISQA